MDKKKVHLDGVYITYDMKPTLYQTAMRVIGVIACVINTVMLFWLAISKVKAFCFLTHWTVFITLAQLLMSLKCSFADKVNLRDRAVSHILFEVNSVCAALVLSVYWGHIHAEKKVEYANNPPHLFHTYIVHLWPQIFFFLDFITTDVKLIGWHAPYLFTPFVVAYSAVLYAGTVYFDKPIYSFLTFKNWKSPAILTGLVIFFMIFYVLLTVALEYFAKEKLE